MNAYEIPNLRFSLPAGAAVERRRFIAVNTDGEGVQATAGAGAVGVSMNAAADGEVLEVADGIVIVEASAAINAGVDVSVATDGKAVTATAMTQSGTTPFAVTAGTVVVGKAITATTGAGQFVAVKMC